MLPPARVHRESVQREVTVWLSLGCKVVTRGGGRGLLRFAHLGAGYLGEVDFIEIKMWQTKSNGPVKIEYYSMKVRCKWCV